LLYQIVTDWDAISIQKDQRLCSRCLQTDKTAQERYGCKKRVGDGNTMSAGGSGRYLSTVARAIASKISIGHLSRLEKVAGTWVDMDSGNGGCWETSRVKPD
jgi:hypothetical protein